MTNSNTPQTVRYLKNNVRVIHNSDSVFSVSFLITGPLGAYIFQFSDHGNTLETCYRATSSGPRLKIKESELELKKRFAGQIRRLKSEFGDRSVNKELPAWLKDLCQ